MDEIVLWEHTGKLADDMPIEEVNAFFRDYVKKYGRKSNDLLKSVDFITVVESRDEDTELFFELVKSWKKTRDLAEDYGATKAVDIADQMFPYLVPTEEELTDE